MSPLPSLPSARGVELILNTRLEGLGIAGKNKTTGKKEEGLSRGRMLVGD